MPGLLLRFPARPARSVVESLVDDARRAQRVHAAEILPIARGPLGVACRPSSWSQPSSSPRTAMTVTRVTGPSGRRRNDEGQALPGLHVGGGDGEDRTPDLLIANQTLSQLSYAPNARAEQYTRIAYHCSILRHRFGAVHAALEHLSTARVASIGIEIQEQIQGCDSNFRSNRLASEARCGPLPIQRALGALVIQRVLRYRFSVDNSAAVRLAPRKSSLCVDFTGR